MMDFLDDNYGVDTIEMGATIAVAMEAGVAKFGDADGRHQAACTRSARARTLGRILGNGAAVTGKVFGVERVPVVKGQAMPAYDPRADPGHRRHLRHEPHGGGPHGRLRGRRERARSVGGDVNPLKPEGQVELSRNLQIATAAIDSTGMCLFIAFAILDQPDTFQALLDLLERVHRRDPDGRRRRGARQDHPEAWNGTSTPGPGSPQARTGCRITSRPRSSPPHKVTFQREGRGPGQGLQLVGAAGAVDSGGGTVRGLPFSLVFLGVRVRFFQEGPDL